jgi:hypothetical protein
VRAQLDVALSEDDSDELIELQWQRLWSAFEDENGVMLAHYFNHCAQRHAATMASSPLPRTMRAPIRARSSLLRSTSAPLVREAREQASARGTQPCPLTHCRRRAFQTVRRGGADALVFAVREWRHASTGELHREILTAKPAQRPCRWLPWTELRRWLLQWQGYTVFKFMLRP